MDGRGGQGRRCVRPGVLARGRRARRSATWARSTSRTTTAAPTRGPTAIFGFADAEQFARGDSEQVAAAFTGQLTRLFGPQAAAPLQVHAVDRSRERYTTPAAPSPRASTGTYSHPQLQEPALGRLHWASTETAPAYAGHIEGALRAGASAANRIIGLTATASTVHTY